MKFTKITPDKAYELYKKGCGHSLYFLDVGCKNYSSFVSSAHYWDKTQTREYFRAFHCFFGEELPKVTVRQEIECHCVDKWNNTNEKVIKMISLAKTGKEFSGYPMSGDLADTLFGARSVTKKYILFDIDSNGEKSNFRFE